MAKVLQMAFLTDEGKKVTLTVDAPREDLTEEEVMTVMTKVITEDVFRVDASPIVKAVSAQIVDRNVISLFKN